MLFQYGPISSATSGMSPETGLAFPIGPFILRTQVEHLVCISAPLYNGSHLGPSRTGGAEGEGGADQRELSPKRNNIENAGK